MLRRNSVTPRTPSDEGVHAAALEANTAGYGYAAAEERTYVQGAPHVKHASVRERYAQQVDLVLQGPDAPASAVYVLDLGAGSGLMSRLWWERGARLTAVDCSAEMLSLLEGRARESRADVTCMRADAADFVARCRKRFQVITLVSTLHHVPDYLALLSAATRLVSPGGSILTFQDPIRYDTLPRWEHIAGELAYLTWRLTRGSYLRGARTRWRRIRGAQSEWEPSDLVEYHVVRNGVDAEAIQRLLRRQFRDVSVVEYWSTQLRILQWLGERAGLRSSFGLVAMGRLDTEV